MNLVFVTLEEANRQCAVKESFIYKVIKRYSFKEVCENILWAFRWFKNSPRLASLMHLPDYFVGYFFGGRQRITGLGRMNSRAAKIFCLGRRWFVASLNRLSALRELAGKSPLVPLYKMPIYKGIRLTPIG